MRNPFRYCGEYFDEESGLIYLRNRYYDPSVGAFINEDPIRDGLNWYVYCNGNPVMFVDPWGLEKEMLKYAVDMLNTTTNYNFSLSWDDTTKTATVMSGGESTGVSYSADDYSLVGGRIIVDSYGLENDLRNAGYNVNLGDAEYCSAVKDGDEIKVSCSISFLAVTDAAIQGGLLLNDYSKQDKKEYGMQIKRKNSKEFVLGDKVYSSKPCIDDNRSVEIPGGDRVVGKIHTHWAEDGFPGFSPADLQMQAENYSRGYGCDYFVFDKNNKISVGYCNYNKYIPGVTECYQYCSLGYIQ